MIGDNLEIYSFDYLLKKALSNVPNTVDKRQGSIIYDALAPACYNLAQLYMDLRQVYLDTFAATATGENLDYRCSEHGITRVAATYAKKKAVFVDSDGAPVSVLIGSRFYTDEEEPLTYVVESADTSEGTYILKCETAGKAGNDYIGNLIAVTYIFNLASATMTDLVETAVDTEDDDSLRTRFYEAVNERAFGGNFYDYVTKIRDIEIDGAKIIGKVQVYPTWQGGGTVKCCVVDPSLEPFEATDLEAIKNVVDPTDYTGEGLGIAPIGHQVTISTASVVNINITATVTLASGATLSQVEPLIYEAVSNYIDEVRDNWAVYDQYNKYSLAVYKAKVVAMMLSASSKVVNVPSLLINGVDSDLILTETSATQQIPKLEEVVLSAG